LVDALYNKLTFEDIIQKITPWWRLCIRTESWHHSR